MIKLLAYKISEAFSTKKSFTILIMLLLFLTYTILFLYLEFRFIPQWVLRFKNNFTVKTIRLILLTKFFF